MCHQWSGYWKVSYEFPIENNTHTYLNFDAISIVIQIRRGNVINFFRRTNNYFEWNLIRNLFSFFIFMLEDKTCFFFFNHWPMQFFLCEKWEDAAKSVCCKRDSSQMTWSETSARLICSLTRSFIHSLVAIWMCVLFFLYFLLSSRVER